MSVGWLWPKQVSAYWTKRKVDLEPRLISLLSNTVCHCDDICKPMIEQDTESMRKRDRGV